MVLVILCLIWSHFDGIRSVVFHPVEAALLTAGEDHVVKLWNLQKSAAKKYGKIYVLHVLIATLCLTAGYASEHIWCLSQARIKWEGCGRRESGVKMGGDGGGSLVSLDGVAPSRMVGVSASVNIPLHHKVQKISSSTGSPGWSRKKGRKTVACVCVFLLEKGSPTFLAVTWACIVWF